MLCDFVCVRVGVPSRGLWHNFTRFKYLYKIKHILLIWIEYYNIHVGYSVSAIILGKWELFPFVCDAIRFLNEMLLFASEK